MHARASADAGGYEPVAADTSAYCRAMSWLDAGVVFALGLAAVDGVLIALLARSPEDDSGASGTRFGLPIGAALPSFVANACNGRQVTEASAHGRLLLFVGNDCHSCHPLVAELAAIDSRERSGLLIIVVDPVSKGHDNVVQALAFMPQQLVIYDPAREIADRLAMPGVPFLYAIDLHGRVRAKHAVFSAELVRSLVKFTIAH